MIFFRRLCTICQLPLPVGFALAAVWTVANPVRTLAQAAPPLPLGAPTAHRARAARQMVALDPKLRALLQQIRRGERSLSVQGEQVTLLYSGPGRAPEQSEQTISFDATRGYRCDYHAPDSIAGEIIVSRADGTWRYLPRRRLLIVGPPRPRRIGAPVSPALRAIRTGQAQALLMGQDTVAGDPATVILIAQASSRTIPAAKLWIDDNTGLQLRTELYDADGQLRSVSYFTQLTYNPRFAAGEFDPPAAPPGTTVRQQQQPFTLSRVPNDSEAGFHVLTPTNLPPGYSFESASVFRYMGGHSQGIALRYKNDLSELSVFERASGTSPNRKHPAASPRAGTVVVRRDGIELIAIGSLADEDLLSVLNSMR